MTYEPREFWERRLAEQFDLRGTGETALSLEYNRACYQLRREVLARALEEHRFDPRSRTVADVGCGTGFFTAYYLERGAIVTGVDIAPTSIERLKQHHPGARFVLADISDAPLESRYDIVNAFDVLYHITDEARWERAVDHLAQAIAPGGLLLLTDAFPRRMRLAAHNRMRSLERYQERFDAAGLRIERLHPTHVLLNKELGPFRFLNRFPRLLLALDRVLIRLGFGNGESFNRLLVARRPA